MSGHKRNLYLVGMPGAGKSTIGKALARKLTLPFVDADHEILNHTGVPISTIFELEGEAGFRTRETQLIQQLCEREGILLATGGGAILKEENRDALRRTGTVIYLQASLENLWQRTRHDHRRPLLNTGSPREALKSLLDARDALYRRCADIVVETGRQSVAKLVHDLADELARRQLWSPNQLAVAGDDPANPTSTIMP